MTRKPETNGIDHGDLGPDEQKVYCEPCGKWVLRDNWQNHEGHYGR